MTTAVGKTTPRPTTEKHGAEVRLPWWAVALPVVGFLALLLLMTASGPAEAAGQRAASFGTDGAVSHVLKHIDQVLPG